MVKEHIENHKYHCTIVVPEHDKRIESPIFRAAKKQLKKDGNYQCWICNKSDKLEVHHYFAEHSQSNTVNFEELKKLCESFDIYGYASKMKDVKITSVDDVRQLMTLCKFHHTGKGGIHCLPFPYWISQKSSNKEIPIPQENETIEDVLERVD